MSPVCWNRKPRSLQFSLKTARVPVQQRLRPEGLFSGGGIRIYPFFWLKGLIKPTALGPTEDQAEENPNQPSNATSVNQL
jgi:hypothetical protein